MGYKRINTPKTGSRLTVPYIYFFLFGTISFTRFAFFIRLRHVPVGLVISGRDDDVCWSGERVAATTEEYHLDSIILKKKFS